MFEKRSASQFSKPNLVDRMSENYFTQKVKFSVGYFAHKTSECYCLRKLFISYFVYNFMITIDKNLNYIFKFLCPTDVVLTKWY